MSELLGLNEDVAKLLRSAAVAEFATVSKDGFPIDTPTLCFASGDLRTIDVATGLAYPVKAERARRNPKVGLLIEGSIGEPIVSIAGIAAVRDADIQANAMRYIEETATNGAVIVPWPVARNAVWYWSRIIICVTPKRISWWDSAADLDREPHRWEAPANTVFPQSDPAPTGSPSAAPQWPRPEWRMLAISNLDRGVPGHLTLLDGEGYPLPVRVRDFKLIDDGIEFQTPKWTPWRRDGKATLCFNGRATFVGEVTASGNTTRLKVQRVLPLLPMVTDINELWAPSASTLEPLMARLTEELARRSQRMPVIPEAIPAPSAGALRRQARRTALDSRSVGP